MKISFDIDGTYTEYPRIFDSLAFMLQMAGHEVGILSGRKDNEADEDHETVDFGFEPDFEYYLDTDPDDDPASRSMEKSTKIQEEDIDMHYDDEAEYFPNYVTILKINPDSNESEAI